MASSGPHAAEILGYLVASGCFILGIRYLGSPKTARRGNLVAAFGMGVALVTTAIANPTISWVVVGPPIAVGAVIGAVSARKVRMTAMPQMVALFNGMGAGAAALISTSEFRASLSHQPIPPDVFITILVSCLIGPLSFSGSLVAFAKLQELITGRPIVWPLQKPLNGVLLLAIIAVDVVLFVGGPHQSLLAVSLGMATLLGVCFVLPVGGGDMPVIISMLNSFTGLAAAATGFAIGNDGLIVAGTLVGASGTILTQLMSKAMNRSIFNVLFAGVGSGGGGAGSPSAAGGGEVHSTTVEDLAPILAYSEQVVIVPGYGLAVSRAQHDVKELVTELERRGVTVKYAIHPVAGRMPGHMNVLLAEADVPYSQLKEMDDINPEFPRTDVAIVIGANDVVNPAARSEQSSPIFGMPILNVDQAHTVVVLKRSMATGFAGVDNPLFYEPNTLMLFGDAKKSITELVAAVKDQ